MIRGGTPATGASYEPGDRLQPKLLHHLLTHDDDKGGAVAGLGRIAGRDTAIGGKNGLQFCQRFKGSVCPGAFIGVDDIGLLLAASLFIHVYFFDRQRQDTIFEKPALDGMDRFLMRTVRKKVLVLAAHVIFLRHGFGGKPHIEVVVRVIGGDGIGRHSLPAGLRDHAHTFCAAGDDTISHTRADLGGGDGDRFQAARAVPVDGYARGVDPYRPGCNDPPHLEPLFGFGDGIADDDVVDAMRVQLGYGSQQVLDNGDRHIIGTIEAKFSAFGFSDSGAVTGYNICVLHRIIFWVVYATLWT